MSTQINISQQDNCKVDHIKVATLASSFITSNGPDNTNSYAFIGGEYSWMSNPTNKNAVALGGNILNVQTGLPSFAIILPVDVDVNDVITLKGIAHGSGQKDPITRIPAKCQFSIGVSYVDCNDFSSSQDAVINTFTLIPAKLFPSQGSANFNICFSLETTDVTLPAGTLLYVGVNCPTNNIDGLTAQCNFSYTLDITKSCAPIPVITNVRIQNCCEQAVFEVISLNTQNLPASGSFSDTEGNCWTIIGITSDPVDTVRFVADPYQDCDACLIANPCPSNLTVESCCSGQSESFTGSLPGINVGDTFIDTYGFCWNVTEETSGPITGLVIVDSITTDCPTCITAPGACPDIYEIRSCCQGVVASLDSNDGPMVAGAGAQIGNLLFTTLDLLGSGVVGGDTFMDQYGYCWEISLSPAPPFFGATVNAAFIQAVTNYGSFESACQTCLTNLNNCDVPVIYKVQNCCSGIIEYVEATFGFLVDDAMSISTTVTPSIYECYKIIEWDNTTTPTITIDSFDGLSPGCNKCGVCSNFYIAKSCDGLTVDKVFYGQCRIFPSEPGEPDYYQTFYGDDNICYYSECEVTSGPATVTVLQETRNCEDCSTFGFYIAVACDGISPNEVILWSSINVGAIIKDDLNNRCYEITTLTIGPATITANNDQQHFENCIDCLATL